jgi:integrase
LRKKRKGVLEQQHQEQQQASIQPLLQQHAQQQQQNSTSNPLNQFIYALRSSEAQKQYSIRLKMFFNFLVLHGTIEEQAQFFLDKAQNNGGVQWTQDNIINFINHHKQRVLRKELAAGTLNNYFMAVKLFCEMNDLTTLNWKRISRGLPRAKASANDRAPTIEEIRKLVEYPDRRIKSIVYTMCSSGIRLGAWNYLRWKHVSPKTNDKGEIIAAKLLVYAGEPEEYYTFITPEAYNTLKTWMDFRASYGEKITGESWVMRDLWQTSNVKYDNKRGLATNPKRLEMDGIEKILNRALWEQNLRQPLAEGVRRHEWKSAHGFRKYFKTRAEQVMKPLNVELLMVMTLEYLNPIGDLQKRTF